MSASHTLPMPPFTVEEFLDWCPDDAQRWQLADGMPFAMAPARIGHGALQGEISRQLGNHVRAAKLPCQVIIAPGIIPNVNANSNFRIPDIGVACAHMGVSDTHMREPILLIEILSPGNERDSWANVWTYTTIPSVREILVLHTRRRQADLLRRQPDGNWPANPLAVTAGELTLDSLGFTTSIEDLYPGADGPG